MRRRPRAPPTSRPRTSPPLPAIAKRYGCVDRLADRPSARGGPPVLRPPFSLGPDGAEIGRYRKTHLTAEERAWAQAGDAYPVFETPFGRIGIMSGYDALFPETSRCLAAAAADIVLWPAAMREPFERELIAVPRAADNRVALVLANRLDSPYPGGSMVMPPTGFPLWDINQVAPRSLAMGAVMPMFIDLAVCRQKQMIPKVDMFANRLTRTYAALVEAVAARGGGGMTRARPGSWPGLSGAWMTTLAETVRQRLADDILRGVYPPGARLDENGLAKRFDLSRTPVREALRQLTSTGLVEMRPRRGVIVSLPTRIRRWPRCSRSWASSRRRARGWRRCGCRRPSASGSSWCTAAPATRFATTTARATARSISSFTT